MKDYLTTTQVAEIVGVPEWRIRRLFETKALPEPPKFGNRRAIQKSMLASVVRALAQRGWLDGGSTIKSGEAAR